MKDSLELRAEIVTLTAEIARLTEENEKYSAGMQENCQLRAELAEAQAALAAAREAIQKRIEHYRATEDVDRLCRGIQINEATGCLQELGRGAR